MTELTLMTTFAHLLTPFIQFQTLIVNLKKKINRLEVSKVNFHIQTNVNI
jgi:hypothetical protein